eukprot:scaffold897_cov185-Chaetoceros_neogracile.AAC.3
MQTSTLFSFILGFAISSIFYSQIHFLTSDTSSINSNNDFALHFDEQPSYSERHSQQLHVPPSTVVLDQSPVDVVVEIDLDEATESIVTNDKMIADENDMCTMLNLKSSSPSFIWKEHLEQIFLASRHGQDSPDEYIWHDFTAKLLNYMTPQRLQTSIKTLPSRYWKQVGNIMKIAHDRHLYKQKVNNSNNKGNPKVEPRKVNILVLGGSVTMGVLCHNNPVQVTSRFSRRNCAWPTRLEQFLNVLTDDLVDLQMITLGGTNTESAIRIWDYALFPSDMPHPDIVIHAYSTNDMHVLSENEAKNRGITLEDMIMEVNQLFIRTILKPQKDCTDRPPPLLLYFDDYVGNEQRELLKTHSFARAAHSLASYYGFGLISYADAVRHLIYADTSEDWFSPNDWPERQVHPGMGMHISAMWIVAFNMLNIATSYCASFDLEREMTHHVKGASKLEYVSKNGLPVLRNDKKLAGEPRAAPDILPPELNTNTSLNDISSKWQSDLESSYFDASSCKANHPIEKPCLFSWVGGLERKFDKIAHLEKRMKQIITTNDGWISSADKGKLGFEAIKGGAVFELKIKLDKQLNVQTLNFMVMTSYGDKWKDSIVRVDAFVDRNGETPSADPAKSLDIEGFHDRHTSETYNHKLDLGSYQALPKDVLRVRITLLGGTTFKFIGMAFCDH